MMARVRSLPRCRSPLCISETMLLIALLGLINMDPISIVVYYSVVLSINIKPSGYYECIAKRLKSQETMLENARYLVFNSCV